MNYFKKIIRKLNRKRVTNRLKRNNKNTDFTLISQNCVGGVLYASLGLPFMSPTINVFIEDENFVKLAENPRHYFSIPAVPKEEKHIDPIDPNIVYPIIAVDDIEICCLHYKSCKEAVEAWERRRKRVNFDNMYIIANSWNLHNNNEYIERLCNLKEKTIVFTLDNYDSEKCIKLQGDFWKLDKRGIVRPNLTDDMKLSGYKYYEKQFDFVKWLNE